MIETEISTFPAHSRRNLLRGAGVLAGGAVLAASGLLVESAVAAPSKMAQNAAGYQDKPMGKSQCDGCTLWQAPASCKTVEGPISPSGWCNLFSAK